MAGEKYVVLKVYEFITRIIGSSLDKRGPEMEDLTKSIKEYCMVVSYKSTSDGTISLIRHSWKIDGSANAVTDLK